MLRFLQQQTFRDQHREIHIFSSGLLETGIHFRLNPFPDRITVRPDNHTSPDRCIIAQFRLFDHIRIPLGKIFAPGCDMGNKFLFLFLGHNDLSSALLLLIRY